MLNISSEKYFCTRKINASVNFQCWASVKQVRSIRNTLRRFATDLQKVVMQIALTCSWRTQQLDKQMYQALKKRHVIICEFNG